MNVDALELTTLPRLARGDVITNADDLLGCLVAACTPRGHYYGDPALVRWLIWWQEDLEIGQVERWLAELVQRGDLVIEDCLQMYGSELEPALEIQGRNRFQRFRARPAISPALRFAVYERDGNACVTCGATSDLSLDHIHPYKLDGADTYENLQTLCRPCNSRKGAKV